MFSFLRYLYWRGKRLKLEKNVFPTVYGESGRVLQGLVRVFNDENPSTEITLTKQAEAWYGFANAAAFLLVWAESKAARRAEVMEVFQNLTTHINILTENGLADVKHGDPSPVKDVLIRITMPVLTRLSLDEELLKYYNFALKRCSASSPDVIEQMIARHLKTHTLQSNALSTATAARNYGINM